MNWYFIRHGQIASNPKKIYSGRSDEPLTDLGRSQVVQGARGLADIPFEAILSSPLTRTLQTAEIVNESTGRDVSIHVEDCFNELLMGPWEGLAEAEVSQRYPREWALWHESPAELAIEGRETLAQLQARVVGGMRDIERRYDYESVLVVTHVAVIRIILLTALNRDLNQYKAIPVGNAEIFDLQEIAGVSV